VKPQGFAEQLAAFTTARRSIPYAWGTHDCVTTAADWVLEIRGTDPIEAIRGTWDSEAGAAAVLEAQGGLIAALDARFPRIARSMAQRGDLVLVKDATGQPSLAICVGSHAWAPGQDEALLTPMRLAMLAWDV
jgi:cell wall-associated NlpC family hydrolase